jgi:hypothetical protein
MKLMKLTDSEEKALKVGDVVYVTVGEEPTENNKAELLAFDYVFGNFTAKFLSTGEIAEGEIRICYFYREAVTERDRQRLLAEERATQALIKTGFSKNEKAIAYEERKKNAVENLIKFATVLRNASAE